MVLDIFGKATLGARQYQEDYFDICAEDVSRPDGCLAVLCDGMGGHNGGALASSTAATGFVNAFVASSGASPGDALKDALTSAHSAIQQKITDDDAPPEMGTTLVAVYIADNHLHWVSVGDSHLYLWRDGQLSKLNQDHSMAAVLDELAEIGRITADEALADPQRNALRSCLSADEVSLVDCQIKPAFLLPGDKLLLASDGLDTLSKTDIESVVTKNRRKKAEGIVDKLLAAVEAADKPGQDNTAVVAIAVNKNRSGLSGLLGRR